MQERHLKEGTKIFFGPPSNPMPQIMVEAIGQVIAQVPGIVEAYLPQCFIAGDSEARQVLVVAIEPESNIPEIMKDLGTKMSVLLPRGQFIDMLPYTTKTLPESSRHVPCYSKASKKWWKFW